MFEIGEYIMCGGHGVCRVNEITSNPFDKNDKTSKFYILQPAFEKGSTVYLPVDSDKVFMRKLMSKEEAKDLVSRIPSIETVWIKEEKSREQMYKDAIRTYDCTNLVQIIKTLYVRKENRVKQGKKVLSSDERYLKKAEDLLYSEMAIVLDMPIDSMGEFFASEVNK